MLSQTASRGLGQQIKAQLMADLQLRALNATLNIEKCLAAGEFVEAWHYLKAWYSLAEDQAPKACPETLACQTAERVELYTAVIPPGLKIHINVTPTAVYDKPPTYPEIREVVGQLRNGSAAGAMGMKVEHLREWIHGIMKSQRTRWRERGIAGDCLCG
jgi:hypothetical protein